jgi:cytochrome c
VRDVGAASVYEWRAEAFGVSGARIDARAFGRIQAISRAISHWAEAAGRVVFAKKRSKIRKYRVNVMHLVRTLTALSLLAFSASSAVAQADLDAGRNVFRRECIACHAFACNKRGPKLHGIFGRPAGALDDFQIYSEALKKSGIVWDAETLDRFLADPAAMVSTTTMTWGKVGDARERRDLVAFLRSGDTSLDLCLR